MTVSASDGRAQLEAEIVRGMGVHDQAARLEAQTYRALQKATKDGSSAAIVNAERRFRQAQLLANSHRKALAVLTDELGYVPR